MPSSRVILTPFKQKRFGKLYNEGRTIMGEGWHFLKNPVVFYNECG